LARRVGDRAAAWVRVRVRVRREGSAMVLPPDGRRRNSAALERNQPAVVLPHVAETKRRTLLLLTADSPSIVHSLNTCTSIHNSALRR